MMIINNKNFTKYLYLIIELKSINFEIIYE